MQIHLATPDDAAVQAIYAPVVTDTAISFETEVPTVDAMCERIASTLRQYPWLVALDDAGQIEGYVYASRASTAVARPAYEVARGTLIKVHCVINPEVGTAKPLTRASA